MQTVALVLGLVAVLAITAALESMRQRRAESRDHARERQAWTLERGQLLDRIADLAGKPWTLPPRPTTVAPPVEHNPDFHLAEF